MPLAARRHPAEFNKGGSANGPPIRWPLAAERHGHRRFRPAQNKILLRQNEERAAAEDRRLQRGGRRQEARRDLPDAGRRLVGRGRTGARPEHHEGLQGCHAARRRTLRHRVCAGAPTGGCEPLHKDVLQRVERRGKDGTESAQRYQSDPQLGR